MVNPYEVLGVSPNASNDEVKRAYRELSRKYHPDSYVNNPLADLAEEKFKQVQEAYDQIMKQRENRGSYSGSSQGGYYSGTSGAGGYNYGGQGQYSGYGQESMELQNVRGYINARRFREALSLLANIQNRNARWYYYSSIANMGIGNNILAVDHANQAAALEPGNMEYVNYANQMQFRGQRYQTSAYNYGRQNYGTGNLCCDLWCADTLCECMGGDLCACM